MVAYGEWGATKAQKSELRELIGKLGWTESWYESECGRIDEMYYFRAIGCIEGLNYLIANPKQWTLQKD